VGRGMHYIIWFLSIALFLTGIYYFRYFYVKKRHYFIPYLIFQVGATLLVVSIFLIGGWNGMFYGMVALFMVAIGLVVALCIFIYEKWNQTKK